MGSMYRSKGVYLTMLAPRGERERAVESGEERAEHERLQLNHVLDWAFG